MKISDYFKLPIEIKKIHFDEKHMVRELNIGDGGECKAVNLAVNNFDDVYMELEGLRSSLLAMVTCGIVGKNHWDYMEEKIKSIDALLAKARGEK